MDDFSEDDLKQLLSVYSDYEYLKLSLDKLTILNDIVSNIKNKIMDKSFLNFLTDFLADIEKEKNQILIQLSLTKETSGTF